MPGGPVRTQDNKIAPPRRGEMKQSMEALIHHFKLYTEGYRVPEGETYTGCRSAEGRIRRLYGRRRQQQALSLQNPAPGFAFLQATDFLSKGHMLADMVAIDRQSMDIVFGEIDR